jgi:hypothetical protein
VEAVFSPENFRIFSDDFRPFPAGKHRKLTGIHRKKSNKFPVGILLLLPAISSAFLLLSCKLLWDPVAVIFDLGSESGHDGSSFDFKGKVRQENFD